MPAVWQSLVDVFSWCRELKNVRLWVNRTVHYCHFFFFHWRRGGENNTLTNHHILPVLQLNNNGGEVNIACVRVFMSVSDGIPGLLQILIGKMLATFYL